MIMRTTIARGLGVVMALAACSKTPKEPQLADDHCAHERADKVADQEFDAEFEH